MANEQLKRFQLRIGPESMDPAELHAADLAKFIQEFLAGFVGTGPDRKHVALVELRHACALGVLAASSELATEFDAYCRNGMKRDFTKWSPNEWAATVAVDKLAKKLGVPWEFGEFEEDERSSASASKDDAPVFRVDVDEVVPPVPAPTTLKGQTTIYGVCLKAGGADPVIWLRLDDGSHLVVGASQTVVQAAGKRLYQRIGLDGTAQWDPTTYEVISFRAKAMNPYRASDAVQGFAKLAELSGSKFEKVSAIEYAREVRGNSDTAE